MSDLDRAIVADLDRMIEHIKAELRYLHNNKAPRPILIDCFKRLTHCYAVRNQKLANLSIISTA